MGTFITNESDFLTIVKDNRQIEIFKRAKWLSFNEHILELGNIKVPSKTIDAISVYFDLEKFTNFCTRTDPHLEVPGFLSSFLGWIFEKIRKKSIAEEFEEGYKLYANFPFLSKFVGDGILFFWDAGEMSEAKRMNIVSIMRSICNEYKTEFLKKHSKGITMPPKKLRCGIARGNIYSVGNGNDYVGPCINMSARIQKLSSLSFCFSTKGFNLTLMGENMKRRFIAKTVEIRGIGTDELVCILKEEFDSLPELEREKFKEAEIDWYNASLKPDHSVE